METKGPIGPPELEEPLEPTGEAELAVPEQAEEPVEQPSTATPQLIKSTKPAEVEVPNEDEELDDQDVLNEHVEEPGDPDGVHAADEEQRWREEHPLPPVTPVATVKRRHPIVKAFIILIVIVAAAFGAYWFGGRQGSTPTKKTTQNSHTSQTQTNKTTDTPTKHYDSTTYTLGFDYPQAWMVSDTAAKLTVTSPAMQLSVVGGSKVNTHVVVAIQNQQTTIAGFPTNGALATLASDKLTYKQPTTIQRAQTYLSYLGYSKTNGLDALYITGDNGYQQGQQAPMSDVVKGNPLISVTFETCASDCTSGTPTSQTLLASSWQATQASKDVTSLLESIQLN